jgi:hypothetical protein
MDNNKLFLVREAQSYFNSKFSDDKERNFKYAEVLVEDVINNRADYEDAYKTTDIEELIMKVANDVVNQM